MSKKSEEPDCTECRKRKWMSWLTEDEKCPYFTPKGMAMKRMPSQERDVQQNEDGGKD